MRRTSTATKLAEKARNAERVMEAARLKRCGLTLKEIGAKLGCSHQRASVLVREGIDAYREEAKQAIAAWLEGALIELRQAQDEAWIQWQRSKQDKQRRTVKTIAAKAGGKARTKKPKMLETTEMVEGQCADAAYLTVITDAIEKCAKLVGIVKPGATNINVTQQAGVSIENPAETKLRQQLATMLAATFPPPGPFIG